MTLAITSDATRGILTVNGVAQAFIKDSGALEVRTAGSADKEVCTMGQSKLASAVAQASVGVTYVDFTGIPSWAKRVTLMFDNLSTNGAGTAPLRIQLGSGSPQTTGYKTGNLLIIGTGASSAISTAGFDFAGVGLTNVVSGSITFTLLGSNLWVAQGGAAFSNMAAALSFSGSVALTGVLDRLRLTTTNGTDLLDLGTVNIMWE